MKEEGGFALLLTLLLVTILISIGVSILNLSLKQVRLASNAKDSEVAFHAANAGLECAIYWRRTASTSMETGATVNGIGCFGVVLPGVPRGNVSGETGGTAYQYQYQFDWGSPVRCTQVNTVVGIATLNGGGLVINNMSSLIPGYPDGNTKTCEAGTKCSVISVQGYNKPCASVNSYGTVQREVLLQL